MERHPPPMEFRLQAAIARSRALCVEARSLRSRACEARLCAQNSVWLAREERARSEELQIHCQLYTALRALVLKVFQERDAIQRAGAAQRPAFRRPGRDSSFRYSSMVWQHYLQLSQFKGHIQ